MIRDDDAHAEGSDIDGDSAEEIEPSLLEDTIEAEPADIERPDPANAAETESEPAPTVPMAAVPPPPVAPDETSSTTKQPVGRWIALSAAALLALALVATGGFFVGQGTRKSDRVVASERNAAVEQAVKVAVEKKGAEDKKARLKIMHRAATRMNAKHRAEIKLLRKSANRRIGQAYSNGSSSGRAAGYADGVDDGITKATDDVVCSDDPDVPLPYCRDYGW